MHTMPAPGTRFRDFLHHSPTGGQRARVVQARRETQYRRRNSLTNASEPRGNAAASPLAAHPHIRHAGIVQRPQATFTLCCAAKYDAQAAPPHIGAILGATQHRSTVAEAAKPDIHKVVLPDGKSR